MLNSPKQVNTMSICPFSCDTDVKIFPEPSLNPASKNAPDITGLTSDCAKIVWYNLWNASIPDGRSDMFVATFKPHTTKEQGKKIVYSPEANGTNFKEAEDSMWEVLTDPKWYMGRWNFTQLCYLEHQPEV